MPAGPPHCPLFFFNFKRAEGVGLGEVAVDVVPWTGHVVAVGDGGTGVVGTGGCRDF